MENLLDDAKNDATIQVRGWQTSFTEIAMITFQCPGCSKQYTVKDEFGGKRTTCRSCQTKLVVPHTNNRLVTQQPSMPIAVSPPPIMVVQPIQETHPCPFCHSEISTAAKKCKHCGETVDVSLRAAEEAREYSRRNQDNGGGNQQVVINQGGGGYVKTFPTALHLTLTLCTCGMWLPVWIIHYIIWSSSH